MRITVVTDSGERLAAESGGDNDDLATQRSDEEIVKKFYGLAGDALGTKRIAPIFDRLWRLEDIEDVGVIPTWFVLD